MAIPVSSDSSVLQPQSVDLGANISKATGEMESQAFENLGQSAIKGAKLISTNRYVAQISDFNSEVQDAQVSMTTNPSLANLQIQNQKIANEAEMTKQVPLLNPEKRLLDQSVEAKKNELGLQAAKLNSANLKRQQYIQFQDTYPKTLKDLHRLSATGSLELANKNGQVLLNQIQGLVSQGVLPAKSAQRIAQTVNTTLERGQDLFSKGPQIAADPVLNAYHKNFAFGNPADQSNLQKSSVEFKYNSALNNQNIADAKRQAASGELPTSFLTNPSVSNSQYQHVLDYYQGAIYARAHISSGLSYPMLQAEKNKLNTGKIGLSPQEEGIRDVLGSVDNQIKTDYFSYYTNQTGAGKEALLDYDHQLVAAKDSGVLSLQSKQQIVQEAEDNFRSGVIAYGQSMGVPAKYIKPFPANNPKVLAIQGSFSAGQNVEPAIEALRSDKRLSPYLSSTLSSPTQQETAHLVSLASEPKGAVMLMKANQNAVIGGKETLVDENGDAIKNQSLLTSLYSQKPVTDYLNFVKSLPGGVQRSGAIQKTLMNTMKYCLKSHPSNEIDDCSNFINSNVIPSESSYLKGEVGGSSYNFLSSEFSVPLSENDAKAVASEAIEKAYDIISAQDNSPLKVNTLSRRKINPLSVSNTPDGALLVYDKQTGQAVYKTYLTSDLINTSRNKLQEKVTKKIKSNKLQNFILSGALSDENKQELLRGQILKEGQ